MASLTADQERLAISRLYHRTGFGPRPGEFEAALTLGFEKTKKNFLVKPSTEQISSDLNSIFIEDLGPRPTPGTFANTEYAIKIRTQIK